MKLHLDKDAFEGIVLSVANREGIRPDVVEKDYYVTLMLAELSENQADLKAYFKGGTALYKALRTMNRFSEDIDLTVYVEDCETSSQKKKRLEKSAEGYNCLLMINDPDNYKSKGSITVVYGYDPIFNDELDDPLRRFGRVKIEATSFTVSEPIEAIEIAALLYESATDGEKDILKNTYQVLPFTILTIKLERIFIDKVFAAEFYFRKLDDLSLNWTEREGYAFDVAKHVYDLMVLYDHPIIQSLLSNEIELRQMIRFKRDEEQARTGGINESLRIRDFSYLRQALEHDLLSSAYQRMQDTYVFHDNDKKQLSDAARAFSAILGIDEG